MAPNERQCWDSRLHLRGRGKLFIFQNFTPFALFPVIIASTPCGGAMLAHHDFDFVDEETEGGQVTCHSHILTKTNEKPSVFIIWVETE